MGCGCGNPFCKNTASNCCGNVSAATPLGGCGTVEQACPENHCQVLINQQFYTALKINNSWNVPDCEGSAQISVTGIKSVLIGSYLWNPNYGYFEIVAFDVDTQQITIQNNCNDGNAAVGTQVPSMTLFVVVDAPLGASSGGSPTLFPYVAVDFTAPNVSLDCSSTLLITVTTVNGLAVGKSIQIGSGTYQLESIPDGTHIEICNNGSGITPGTSVFAKNSSNQFQYPIILIDSNPCTNNAVLDGCLIVCKDDIMQPLGDATVLAGMVPTITTDGDCEVSFKMLDVPTRTCSSILCCLTLIDGDPGPYTIKVTDSSQFTVGDLLQIGTRTDRFTVTVIVDATHIQATVDPVPGATIDIDPGTSICIADCCEIINMSLAQDVGGAVDDNPGVLTLNSGSPTQATPDVVASLTNTSLTKSMIAFASIRGRYQGVAGDTNTDTISLLFRLQKKIDAGAFAIVDSNTDTYFDKTDGGFSHGGHLFNLGIHTILPGVTLTITAKTDITWLSAGSSFMNITAGNLVCELDMYGVAV